MATPRIDPAAWNMNRLLERIPAHVREFECYVPSRPDPVLMRQYGVSHLYRLNNNENALGPPPLAGEVLAALKAGRAAQYPSGDSYDLRQALAARFGKSPGRFLVGNGSTEIIAAVIKSFCEPGDSIVTADQTFAVYEWVGRFSGLETRLALRRQSARSQETSDHQEHLDCHAPVGEQPVEDDGEMLACRFGQGAVG